MSLAEWTAVDRYINDLLVGRDAALDAAVEASAAAGLPPYAVSPSQGKLLMMLVVLARATSVLEIGTLGGYSTIWLARAVASSPGGRVVSLEADANHAAVARANIARGGLAEIVDVRVGPALETLPTLASEGPFDAIFLDADKPNNPEYLAWSLRLAKKGTLIIADNTIREGKVIDAASADPSVRGIRRFHDLVAADPRLTATAIQTVGEKGWDGLTIAIVD
jgi:predicted O-methyltransferase YrrM